MYYMVIFPKFILVTQVPLAQPMNSYYMIICQNVPGKSIFQEGTDASDDTEKVTITIIE